MSGILEAAARVRPPIEGDATDLAVVAATPSAATATGAGGGADYWFTVASSSAFNIRFSNGNATVTNPTDTSSFPAGVHSFALNGKNTHFKVTAAANGYITYWHSSRT